MTTQNNSRSGRGIRRGQMTGADALGGSMSSFLNTALLGGGDSLLGFMSSPAQEQRRALGLESGNTPVMNEEAIRALILRRNLERDAPLASFLMGTAGVGVGAPSRLVGSAGGAIAGAPGFFMLKHAVTNDKTTKNNTGGVARRKGLLNMNGADN